MTAELKGAHRSIRGHLILGLSLMLVLAGGFGGWASTVQISGALIAPGSVVVDSNVKKVQHPTGGVVGEVRVRDGDIVKAGDVVVRLDETVVKASLAIVVKTLNGLWARAARLEAEQRGLDQIKFPHSSPIRRAIPMSATSWPAKPNCSRFACTGAPGKNRNCASGCCSSTRKSPASRRRSRPRTRKSRWSKRS